MSSVPDSIDFRGEIVAPSAGMREAMAAARVGPDLFHDDPTVNALEARIATLLGKEAAIFVPTVTLGNLIALRLLGKSGDEVLVDYRSHIYDCELAGVSAVCGLLPRPLRGDRTGLLPAELVHRVIRARLPSRAQTTLLCLENTHTFAGGTVLDQAKVSSLCQSVRERGLKLHLDGARLFHASVSNGLSSAELAAPFDTVVVSFSKGLGAPGGAALAGDRLLMEEARRVRKMLGGSMPQPGVLAAACLYGLDHHSDKLVEDHSRAQILARCLAMLPWASIEPHNVDTNIVIFEPIPRDAGTQIECGLRARGVLTSLLEDGRMRLVTHLDITDQGLERALEVFRSFHVN